MGTVGQSVTKTAVKTSVLWFRVTAEHERTRLGRYGDKDLDADPNEDVIELRGVHNDPAGARRN